MGVVPEEAGAPAEVWTEVVSPAGSANLYYDVTWVNKTATRLPEVRRGLWHTWRLGPHRSDGLVAGVT